MKRFLAILFLGVCSGLASTKENVETFQVVWQTIRDTHFDTNFNGVDWNAARAKYLPKIEKAESRDEARAITQEMLDLLGHSHLMIIAGSPPDSKSARAKRLAASGDGGTVGIEVRALTNRLVIFRVEKDSAAEKAGVKAGWIIEKIDGEPAIDASVAGVGSKTRDFLQWRHAEELLGGGMGDVCELVLNTGAGLKTVSIGREEEKGEIARLGNLPVMLSRVETNSFRTGQGKRVGYVRFNLWMIPAIEPLNHFVDEYRNADGIVIDLRGNLGGIGGMVMGTAGHFVNQRASLGKMKMRDNELNFNLFPRRVDTQGRATNTFQGKLAILTDAITLSSAELFAGGLQELKRARVFGERTGGQALPSISDRLPNGDLLYHAVADFTTPSGHRLEVNGVVPDEVVPLRMEALRAGKDEPLEAALRWIDASAK